MRINIFKMKSEKEDDFLNEINEKFTYCENNEKEDETFHFFYSQNKQEKQPKWQWLFEEFKVTVPKYTSSPNGILLYYLENDIFALSFGTAFHILDKYCQKDFGIEFAKRCDFNQIKTTTSAKTNSKINKQINSFTKNNSLNFNTGDTFAKIKGKVDFETIEFLKNGTLDIGNSIKITLKDNTFENIKNVVEYILDVINNKKVCNRIPVFNEIKQKDKIVELETKLNSTIQSDLDEIYQNTNKQINSFFSNYSICEIEVIGADEIINNNNYSYTLQFKDEERELDTLTEESIKAFVLDMEVKTIDEFNKIKVVRFNDCYREKPLKITYFIEYIDEENNALLSSGVWNEFNNDYLEDVDNSIKEIDVIYNEKYNLSITKYQEFRKNNPNSEKVYKEQYFNKYFLDDFDFICRDRELTLVEKHKVELMDLYKDNTAFAVKIGKSSNSLSFCVDQSLESMRLIKNKEVDELTDDFKVEKIGVWLILDRKKGLEENDGKVDLTQLKMLILKSKINEWKNEVRLAGYEPIIYINYVVD